MTAPRRPRVAFARRGIVAGGWRSYLDRFHDDRAGITTATLGTARSGDLDPYGWALQPLGVRDRIVDIACGDGPVRGRCPSPGWVGLDASGAELRRARSLGASSLVRADAVRLPLATASAASVVCSMALMVIQPLGDALAEIRRVLSADGTAVALLPGRWPLGVVDLARYAGLAVTLRCRLAYPNDRRLAALPAAARGAGLRVVDDRRRCFALPLPDEEAARRFVASLYVPGVDPERRSRAAARAAGWVPGTIGIPLRRVVLRPAR